MTMLGKIDVNTGAGVGVAAMRGHGWRAGDGRCAVVKSGARRVGGRCSEWMREWGGAKGPGWAPEGRGGVTPDGRRLLIGRAMLLRGVVELRVSRDNRKMEQQA